MSTSTWVAVPQNQWGNEQADAGRQYRLTLVLRAPFSGAAVEFLVNRIKDLTRSSVRFHSVEIFDPAQTERLIGADGARLRPWMLRLVWSKRTTNTPLLYFVLAITGVITATVSFVVVSKTLERSFTEAGDAFGAVTLGALVLGGLYLLRRG